MVSTMPMRIKGYTFTLSAPYAEGHQLTGAEAKALNDLRTENIGNNFRSRVNEQISRLAPGELLPQNILDGLIAELAVYDAGYQFVEKLGRAKIGDIEREAKSIAQERVRAELQNAQHGNMNFNSVEWTADKTDALANQYAVLPEVIEEARSRVAARRSALAGGMDSL